MCAGFPNRFDSVLGIPQMNGLFIAWIIYTQIWHA